MSYGTYERAFPRARFYRGWNPQEPGTLTKALPVASGNIIYSGQIISPSADGTGWELGVSADKAKTYPALIAIAQDDSRDPDVLGANSLVGLLCSGKFRIGTPYFLRKDTQGGNAYAYTVGTKLTYCINTETDYYDPRPDEFGQPMDGATEQTRSAAGFVRPAKDGEPVIGVVSEAGIVDLRASVGTATDSTSTRDNAFYVVFDTTFSPDVVKLANKA